MELSKTLSQCWSRNRQRKLRRCRTWNQLWKLSHGWWMESTTNTNQWFANEINREKRVIVDAWNHHWKLCHYWPLIVGEKIIAGELEIITEIWVTADVWNRQHDLCVKSIAKIDSWLTHGIVKNTKPMLSRNRHRRLGRSRTRNQLWKLCHCWWMKSTTNTNPRFTNEINRGKRVIVDLWNR